MQPRETAQPTSGTNTHAIILSFSLFYAPWFLIHNPHFSFQPEHKIKLSFLELYLIQIVADTSQCIVHYKTVEDRVAPI